MNGHLSSLCCIVNSTNALVEDIIKGESSPYVGALFPILRIDKILGLECSSRPDDTSQFSFRAHIKRDLSCVNETLPWPLILSSMLSISSTKIIVFSILANSSVSYLTFLSTSLP